MMFQTLTLLETSPSFFQGGAIPNEKKSLIESHVKFQRFLLPKHENKNIEISFGISLYYGLEVWTFYQLHLKRKHIFFLQSNRMKCSLVAT